MLYLLTGTYVKRYVRELLIQDTKRTEMSRFHFFPDSEMHPREQSELGAKYLRQSEDQDIYVTTFSEHILNGMRVETVRTGIPFEVWFYEKESDIPTVLKSNLNGNMSDWPVGFFDQAQKDLYQILQLRKEREL